MSFIIADRQLVRGAHVGRVTLDYAPGHGVWTITATSASTRTRLYRGTSLAAAIQTANRAIDHRICSGWHLMHRPDGAYLRREGIARLRDEMHRIGDPSLSLMEALF